MFVWFVLGFVGLWHGFFLCTCQDSQLNLLSWSTDWQARLQRTTKLKRILQDTREAGGESDIRERMQPLNTQLVDTISHLHDVFTTRVFVAVCRGFWDRMARVCALSFFLSQYSFPLPNLQAFADFELWISLFGALDVWWWRMCSTSWRTGKGAGRGTKAHHLPSG